MIVAVVGMNYGWRDVAERKLRDEICMHGIKSHDLVGRLAAVPNMDVRNRAMEALRSVLFTDHEVVERACTADDIYFVDLLPAYALRDSAETLDKRLVAMTALWGDSPTICATIVVVEEITAEGDTLVDAARDLSRRILVVTKEDVFDPRYGKRAFDFVVGGAVTIGKDEEEEEDGRDFRCDPRVREQQDGKVPARRRKGKGTGARSTNTSRRARHGRRVGG